MNATKIDIQNAGGIIIKDRKVLVHKAKGEEVFLAPGGSIEPGETPKQALVRELNEEIRILVDEKNLETFGTFASPATNEANRRVQIEAFLVKLWAGDIQPDSETEEIKWIDSKTNSIKIGWIFKNEILPKLKSMNLID